MKKLLTVTCLAGLLSIPSVVFAEASWYGSIRTGITTTTGNSGLDDASSRWGVKGSSEVAEGLTAVYRFEHKLNSTAASLSDGGRLSYVGLSGGFGTITLGQVWSASYNSFGAITDNSLKWGSAETTYRHGNVVSYSVSFGNTSLQADAVMDSAADKTVDAFEIGTTIGGIMESGTIAVAHKSYAETADDPDRSATYFAGKWGFGAMSVYLGMSQDENKFASCDTAAATAGLQAGTAGTNSCNAKVKEQTIFAGLGGSVGDTGVSYVFQLRNKEEKTTTITGTATTDRNTPVSTARSTATTAKSDPWILLLSRSLGGGASVHFEHSDSDDGGSSSSGVWLKVDF